MTKKRKAFTLTELLVVVVIIGVLSAVVLPKFNKVLEARKTTEAEEMMVAVRNEQEARCALGKNYQATLTKLGVYRGSKNFDYSGKTKNFGGEDKIIGVIASAKNGKYALEIPSYADGRICCSDNVTGGCADLGKNYPTCTELAAKTNYVAPNGSCGALPPPPPDEPEPNNPSKIPCDPAKQPAPFTQACEVPGYEGQNCGLCTKGYHCDETTGYEWQENDSCGECTATDKCQKTPPCDTSKPKPADDGKEFSGEDGCTYQRTYPNFDKEQCAWMPQDEKVSCPQKPCDKEPKKDPCPNGQSGEISYGVNEDCEYYEISNTCSAAKKTCKGWRAQGKTCPWGDKEYIWPPVGSISESQFDSKCCKHPTFQWVADWETTKICGNGDLTKFNRPQCDNGLACYPKGTNATPHVTRDKVRNMPDQYDGNALTKVCDEVGAKYSSRCCFEFIFDVDPSDHRYKLDTQKKASVELVCTVKDIR